MTNISVQLLIDELWNTMGTDLKQLAFDQGDVEDLRSEELMLARIKSLAVTVQHAAVHTVSLHSAQQHQDESTKAFAARVRGIASNCNLAAFVTSMSHTLRRQSTMWSLLASETETYRRDARHRHSYRISQTSNLWWPTAQQMKVAALAPVPQ